MSTIDQRVTEFGTQLRAKNPELSLPEVRRQMEAQRVKLINQDPAVVALRKRADEAEAKALAEQQEREKREHATAKQKAAAIEAEAKADARIDWLRSGGDPDAFQTAWPEIWRQRLIDQVAHGTGRPVPGRDYFVPRF